jgi:hypothetical protein
MGLGRRYLDVLVAEFLAGTPGDGRLAGDGLQDTQGELVSGMWHSLVDAGRDRLLHLLSLLSILLLTLPAVDAIAMC